ncbi:hypothetical protein KC339_g146 [Hortaea werneckii]|nr:hypothetical protein KC339_g146 [Hortaea werneckii]
MIGSIVLINVDLATDDTRDHTNAHDQNHDAREAQGRMCNLGDVERFTHDQDGDGKELLERLCEVDAVARLLAEEAEEWVAVTAHRIARGVHVEENLPQGPTAEACEDTEDDEDTYGAPDQPRISVVIRKNIWPQDAVLMARAATRHSASEQVRGEGSCHKVYSSKVTVSSTRAARPQVRSWTVFFSVETLDALRASASIAISISAVGWLAGFTGYTSMVTASLFHANVENQYIFKSQTAQVQVRSTVLECRLSGSPIGGWQPSGPAMCPAMEEPDNQMNPARLIGRGQGTQYRLRPRPWTSGPRLRILGLYGLGRRRGPVLPSRSGDCFARLRTRFGRDTKSVGPRGDPSHVCYRARRSLPVRHFSRDNMAFAGIAGGRWRQIGFRMQELSERDQKKYASMEEMPRAASNGKPRFGIALRAEAIRPRSSPSTLAFERLHSAVSLPLSLHDLPKGPGVPVGSSFTRFEVSLEAIHILLISTERANPPTAVLEHPNLPLIIVLTSHHPCNSAFSRAQRREIDGRRSLRPLLRCTHTVRLSINRSTHPPMTLFSSWICSQPDPPARAATTADKTHAAPSAREYFRPYDHRVFVIFASEVEILKRQTAGSIVPTSTHYQVLVANERDWFGVSLLDNSSHCLQRPNGVGKIVKSSSGETAAL